MVRQLQQVAIVVDSSCCLPAPLTREWGITVAPHELVIDGRAYRDGVDITPQEFYRRLKTLSGVPTTAAPTPQRFSEAIAAARLVAPNVLCLTVSSNFSATYAIAQAAAQRADTPRNQVKVVDSHAAAGALGLITLAAARWARKGCSLEAVARRVEALLPRVNLLAFLDTLDYLGRSGRVGKVKAWTGSLLGIKPVTELKGGEARLLERPRSRARATERLISIMRERVGDAPVRVNVMEADAATDAAALRQQVAAAFQCRELFVSQFTPVMGAHIGPGLLGLAFYVDDIPQEAPCREPER